MPIRFTTVTDTAGFQRLEPAWRALMAQLGPAQFFLGFDWCWHAWEQLIAPTGRGLRILVGTVGDGVVLIWPLMLGGPYLRFLGTERSHHCDILVAPGPRRAAWIGAALRAARGLGGAALLLRNLRPDSHFAQFLAAQRPPGRIVAARHTRCVRLDRFASWDAYWASRPHKLISDQRRQWRRLTERAPARFEFVYDWPAMRAAIDWMLARKVAWLHTRGEGDDLFATAPYQAVIVAAAQALLAQGATCVARLRAGDATIAATLAFRQGDTLLVLVMAHDPAWHRFSPSRLLYELTLQWCFRHGIGVFDLLTGEEEYKALWATDEATLLHCCLPLTLQGRTLLAWHAAGLGATGQDRPRMLTRLLPGRLRRRLASNAPLLAAMQPIRDWQAAAGHDGATPGGAAAPDDRM